MITDLYNIKVKISLSKVYLFLSKTKQQIFALSQKFLGEQFNYKVLNKNNTSVPIFFQQKNIDCQGQRKVKLKF